MIPLLPALAAGLLLGSFLNVCIARLPKHRSVVRPPSHCPRCGAAIWPWDNIPLLSFLLLRGRCRACRSRISARYPLVEAGLAALFCLCAGRFASLPAAEAGVLCFLLLGLLAMDAETWLLPDSFTLPGAALGLVQAALPGGGLGPVLALTGTAPLALPHWHPLVGSLLGAALGAGFLLGVRAVYGLLRKQEGMGLGDVKLAGMLGAWFGVAGVALTLLLAVLGGAVVGITLLATRKNDGPLPIPFGIFLCAGGLATLFVGRAVLTWYFHFWV